LAHILPDGRKVNKSMYRKQSFNQHYHQSMGNGIGNIEVSSSHPEPLVLSTSPSYFSPPSTGNGQSHQDKLKGLFDSSNLSGSPRSFVDGMFISTNGSVFSQRSMSSSSQTSNIWRDNLNRSSSFRQNNNNNNLINRSSLLAASLRDEFAVEDDDDEPIVLHQPFDDEVEDEVFLSKQEDFVPSSLSELLTPQEQMKKLHSTKPTSNGGLSATLPVDLWGGNSPRYPKSHVDSFSEHSGSPYRAASLKTLQPIGTPDKTSQLTSNSNNINNYNNINKNYMGSPFRAGLFDDQGLRSRLSNSSNDYHQNIITSATSQFQRLTPSLEDETQLFYMEQDNPKNLI
jgi:hypothetical protein